MPRATTDLIHSAHQAAPVNRSGALKPIVRRSAVIALRAAEMAASGVYLSWPAKRLRAAASASRTVPTEMQTAAVAHLYYPDVLPETLAAWAALPQGSRLLITAPPTQAQGLMTTLAGKDNVEVHAIENRGRDIAPFLALLGSGSLDRFDVVLKLHSKKSPHLHFGNLRRMFFFEALAGSRGAVARILNRFTDSSVGFVGPRAYFRSRRMYWMDDRPRVEELCARMRTPVRLGFFEGAMFWVRPSALNRLRKLDLKPGDFEPEVGQLDGTLHHAVERCFVLSGLPDGYEALDLWGRRLTPR